MKYKIVIQRSGTLPDTVLGLRWISSYLSTGCVDPVGIGIRIFNIGTDFAMINAGQENSGEIGVKNNRMRHGNI